MKSKKSSYKFDFEISMFHTIILCIGIHCTIGIQKDNQKNVNIYLFYISRIAAYS